MLISVVRLGTAGDVVTRLYSGNMDMEQLTMRTATQETMHDTIVEKLLVGLQEGSINFLPKAWLSEKDLTSLRLVLKVLLSRLVVHRAEQFESRRGQGHSSLNPSGP